jgi:acylphosphatase
MSTRSSDGEVRRHLIVRGLVQGVGFRAAVLHHALRTGGLRGFVRNRADGSVEVECEGARASVEALRDFLGRGPRGAVVEAVEERPPGSGPLPSFCILP